MNAHRYIKDRNGFERLICPQCGGHCDAEFVDIGVGNQRVEPWHCPACLWIEGEVAPRETAADPRDPVTFGECTKCGHRGLAYEPCSYCNARALETGDY